MVSKAITSAFVLNLFAILAFADQLETLEGQSISGTLESITKSGEVLGDGIPAGITIDSLRSIARDTKTSDVKAKLVVESAGGGKLKAESLTLANDKFAVGVSGISISLSLDAVRVVRFEPDLELAMVTDAVANPSADFDRVFVKVEKQVEVIKGLVSSLSDAELKIEVGGEVKSLARDRVHAIVLAQPSSTAANLSLIHLTDGSQLAAKSVALAGPTLTLDLPGGAKAEVPFERVQRIDIRSARVKYVSDVEPDLVREEPILTLAMPWQRDKSVGGKPLTLGKRTYARGIGVHSRSELTFAIPEGFDRFIVTVGIDAETLGRGDCEVKVLLDNREAISQRVKGGEAPSDLQVELKGAKRMTLLVEPGMDLDLADHLDWCDARWMKTKTK